MDEKECRSCHELNYGTNILAWRKWGKQQTVSIKMVITSSVKLNTVVHMSNG
jgi:hypothetical protein